ncbi:M20/M25/M40 family metallo-hydrolase [Oscillochloris sp. ZM17-4]|uniref:M20 family metallopeptidase n=1 Tax=Oscillochloris sp. ZM17-4 TaxID=2866714 RepID=UPI001C738594|nr:M20/M25/M40 family metallo-hydrolase [Oscillochloris sp. ZM17-4]MBX0331600.1 M20/M25/M40 family metallo-hydrolase [Oscillochloris sp. ZM17-4]
MPASSLDQGEAVALLRQLVAIRSYPGEERAAQLAVAEWLTASGLTPELQPTPNQQPNVIAHINNGPGPTLLLNGHIDTVLAVEGWDCDPWQGKLDGDRLSALGAGDMKSGVVVNMLVARELLRRRDEWRGTLIFSCVTDEEAHSLGARALIAGLKADACFVTEPSFAQAIIGAPGKVLLRVTATGKAAHGFMPEEGVNAAIELARFVAQVCDAAPTGTHPRIPSSQTVLSFHSGSAQYVITLPERAEALLTRQIVPGESAASVLAQLRAFADSLRSPASFDIQVEPPFYPPFEFNVAGHPFAQAFSQASSSVLGAEVPFGYMVGVSDANLTSGEAGIPTIVFGPRAGDFHQCTEWVDLSSIIPCAEVILTTALAILAGPQRPPA